MARIPLDIVDAFADRPFSGNPAAIIPDASDLSEREMMQIAGELRMEAGFVLPPEVPESDLRLRFFTPRGEAMLSGHVLVAAFVSLADRGLFHPAPAGRLVRCQTSVGVRPVILTVDGDERTRVTIDLPLPRFGEPVAASEVAAALELPTEMVKLDEHRPQRVSCGFDVLVTPITDRHAARGAFTNMAAIRQLADRLGVSGVACFCPETSSPEVDLFCRFFYPSIGMDEDVVSGTSLGAIAAYCLDKGVLPRASHVEIVSEQGHARGRPNRATVQIEMQGPRVTQVRLTAAGAVVMRGEFLLEERVARAAV
jgi:trans-2,3-dihydro-3-hydroxyanthranilate isomerase